MPDNRPIVLHYLGPPGTYSHQVSLDLVPNLHFDRTYSDDKGKRKSESLKVALKPCKSIRETFKGAQELAAQSNLFSLALLPFENNSNGPVQDSYGILHNAFASTSRFWIVAEAYLPVSHSLLVTKEVWAKLKGDKEQVELSDLQKLDQTSSHPQALGQCSKFIKEHMRADIHLHESNSTGEAAQQLLNLPSEGGESSLERLRACIASKVCTKADVYDLVEIFGNIQNSNGNTTRFLLCRLPQGIKQDQMFVENYQKFTNKTVDRCRFIYHLTEKNISDNSLFTFMDSVRRTDVHDPDYSGKYTDPVTLDIKIRKVDRSTIRSNDLNNVEEEDYTCSEGIWGYTYLAEMEISQSSAGEIMSKETSDGKRRKLIAEPIKFSKLERAVERYLSETDANFHLDKIESKVQLLGRWYV
ncbi:PDT-domain-containing protein [Meira miltonrushii]|uniref:PDT-domain-containing protein n=1 Tax=Meira miltonrushii TaxID=1280837 RepID=A0A316V3L4_9BASI|nr:PDT-domain-containing protein [Meira miltonrushii]PWN32042.1 PDT-domain-containing protein [Meira miltonrushii]